MSRTFTSSMSVLRAKTAEARIREGAGVCSVRVTTSTGLSDTSYCYISTHPELARDIYELFVVAKVSAHARREQ